MPLRFRKSLKIGPGVRMNIGKKSMGLSFGGKYGGVSANTSSGVRGRVSAPGTGLGYTSKLAGGKNASQPASQVALRTRPGFFRRVLTVVTWLFLVGLLIAWIANGLWPVAIVQTLIHIWYLRRKRHQDHR